MRSWIRELVKKMLTSKVRFCLPPKYRKIKLRLLFQLFRLTLHKIGTNLCNQTLLPTQRYRFYVFFNYFEFKWVCCLKYFKTNWSWPKSDYLCERCLPVDLSFFQNLFSFTKPTTKLFVDNCCPESESENHFQIAIRQDQTSKLTTRKKKWIKMIVCHSKQ